MCLVPFNTPFVPGSDAVGVYDLPKLKREGGRSVIKLRRRFYYYYIRSTCSATRERREKRTRWEARFQHTTFSTESRMVRRRPATVVAAEKTTCKAQRYSFA